MKDIRISNFSGKDGRKWTNIVFIGENHVTQWFGETEKAPININTDYYVGSTTTNGKYGVTNIVADDGSSITVFVKVII